MLATPSAQDSLPLCDRVSVRSSTSLAVSSVSNRPTKATLIAVGQMMRSVLRSSGTTNAVMPGNPGAIAPSPPTLGTVRCPRITIDVTTMDGDQRRRNGCRDPRHQEDDRDRQCKQRDRPAKAR